MRPPAAPRRPVASPPAGDDLVLDLDDAAEFEALAARGDDGDTREPADARHPEEESPSVAAPVSTLATRRREHRRAYWRVLWFRIGIALGVVALLALLVWLVWFSPVLALRADRVTVTGGSTYLDAAAVTEMVAVDDGVPLVRIDTGAHAAAIAQLPAVADVSVTRDWPGGIAVDVTPREPVAIAGSSEGSSVDLVGADGVVVASVPTDAVPAGLPWLAIDMTSDDGAQTVTAVLSVLGALTPQLSEQIAEVRAESPGAIVFVLGSGAEVVWGSAEDVALKDRVLLTLLQVGASYYDVSTPLAPITR